MLLFAACWRAGPHVFPRRDRNAAVRRHLTACGPERLQSWQLCGVNVESEVFEGNKKEKSREREIGGQKVAFSTDATNGRVRDVRRPRNFRVAFSATDFSACDRNESRDAPEVSRCSGVACVVSAGIVDRSFRGSYFNWLWRFVENTANGREQ